MVHTFSFDFSFMLQIWHFCLDWCGSFFHLIFAILTEICKMTLNPIQKWMQLCTNDIRITITCICMYFMIFEPRTCAHFFSLHFQFKTNLQIFKIMQSISLAISIFFFLILFAYLFDAVINYVLLCRSPRISLSSTYFARFQQNPKIKRN